MPGGPFDGVRAIGAPGTTQSGTRTDSAWRAWVVGRPRDPRYWLRVGLVALVAYLFFGHVCAPMRARGGSMEPTCRDGSFIFILKAAYLFSAPHRGDIVAIRMAGERVMMLKRVVALEGQTVEFRQGALLVDGRELDEPYVKLRGDWELPPRKVDPGNLYVVGDNRAMPIDAQIFGQTETRRLAGKLLW